ncbi:MAG TPA: hypothetical protein VFX13_01990 [Gaiellales bacterium]|nr:hypothetical protein [Gaiellales bacterium]
MALTAARVRVATRAVNGGSVSQRDLLQEILGRVDSRLFTQVELTPPPAGYDQFPATDGTWIDFTTAAGGPSGSGPDALIASWEAMIVAGAYRDLSAAACVPASVGLSTSFVRADGTPADISGGDGVLGPVPSSDPADYTEREITQTVESNIGQVGLHLDSIRFIEPNHLVPIVVATTQDPAGFVKHDYSLQSLFGDVSRYEGLCVEVLDTNGAPVEVVGVSNRIDQATRWIRPGLSSPSAGDAYPSPGG